MTLCHADRSESFAGANRRTATDRNPASHASPDSVTVADVISIVICSFQFRLLTQKRREAGEWQAPKGGRARRLSPGASDFPPSPPYCEKGGRNGSRKSKIFLRIACRGWPPRKGGRIR